MSRKPLPGQLDLDGEPYVPPPPPVPVKRGPPKPTWGRLVKRDKTCDDCFMDQVEAAKAGEIHGLPARRIARYRRTLKGEGLRLLCNPHADLWRARDRLPKLDHDKNGTRV